MDWRPLAVLLVLFATLFALRQLSPHLDIDEAHFYAPGQLAFAWGYDGSQPPLFNWLLSSAYWLTGGDLVVAVSALRFTLNFIAWALTFVLVVKATGRHDLGLLAVAALALMPQVIWQMQITLAHSVLVHTAAVASLYALYLAVTRGTLASYATLGLALSAGILAKYSFLVALVLCGVAVASHTVTRQRLRAAGIAVMSAVIVAVTAPHALWAVSNWQTTSERMERIQVAHRDHFDLPYVGVDGLLTLGWSVFMTIGPALIIWGVIALLARREQAAAGHADASSMTALAPLTDTARDWADLWGRMLAFGLGGTALAIFVFDIHRVEPRYLIPLGAVFAPLFATAVTRVALPHRAIRAGLMISGAILLVLPVAYALKTTSGGDRLSLPYARIADDIVDSLPARARGDVTIITRRQVTAANIARQLPRPSQLKRDQSQSAFAVVANTRKDLGWFNQVLDRLRSCGFSVTPRRVRAIPYV
ncbi:MAG: glycosyltransferase family 39 protein, partial [Pseudomonadota bacterium]